MSRPKVKAQNQIVVGPDSDAIHFVDTRGNIIAWIDGTGVLQGNLATTTGGNTTNLHGGPVSPIPPAPNQVLSWNGATWVPVTVSVDTSLQGNPISPAVPQPNQVLGWNGSAWVPSSIPPPPPPGPTNNLQGIPVSPAPPQLNQALVWDGAAWSPGTIKGGGQTINFSDAETPKGTIDGLNKTFTLSNIPNPSASLLLFSNGVLQQPPGDYTLLQNTITFMNPPSPPNAAGSDPTGDLLEAFYRF
jgi:hypothetical protein